MMLQYNEIKAKNADCILFFRLGDFYEMFGEDAKKASKELDLTLTTRDRSAPPEEQTPMCGVPYHSAEAYIARLIAKGYKVAICEQTEDPAEAKTIVRREVVRIITPGTAIESSMLEEGKNNFICSVAMEGRTAGVAFADISTGEMYCTEVEGRRLSARVINELSRFSPTEVLLNGRAFEDGALREYLHGSLSVTINRAADEAFDPEKNRADILEQFHQESLEPLGLRGKPAVIAAAGALLGYLRETQKTELLQLNLLHTYASDTFLELDAAARRNLELCQTLRGGERRGSLLWVIDKTRTSMGSRLIRSWVEKPLSNPVGITRRHRAVEALVGAHTVREDLREEFRFITDIERTVSRVAYGTAGGRDLRALAEAAGHIPTIRALAEGLETELIKELAGAMDELRDIAEMIDRAIVENPPVSVREGGFIKKGYHEELDALRDILKGGRGGLAAIEAREREATGIKSLKVSYNKVFGYYIEVTKTHLDKVPPTYIRKQTLVNCERYITDELKKMEETILSAGDRIDTLEYQLFSELREKIAGEVRRIQGSARAIAQLDVLSAFAETAVRYGYCCPEIDDSDRIEITDGRHPVVERMLETPFVPNDTFMDNGENMIAIITGPNMAGKSTYMRQVALITLLAQMGSFVPAKSARIGVCDRIFTRIGASDDLAAGQSTFMVEMREVADILSGITKKSLVILDEVGRGTSTFDGMAIARAVVEWLSDKKRGAKTLFATHYHELVELEAQLPGVKNYNIAVKKRGGEIVFLRKIVRGGTDDSYGIEVARLAGLPPALTDRADALLHTFEKHETGPSAPARDSGEAPDGQVSFLDMGERELAGKLLEIDLNTLTPIEGMNILFELKKKAEGK
ncbi:DNA mismatch repair protein MutS [Oscillospiraceae bacterium OttesenSCG-928-F05]|nr:DNA mismatch repair protein MutS [Oscillospiraceae bacterium OttesenSCG-928-F05]